MPHRTPQLLRRCWPTLSESFRTRASDLTGLALIPTLKGSEAIRHALPTAAELRRESDRLIFELALGDLDLDAIEAAREPEPHVPTLGELRDQAKALGIALPRSRTERIKTEARH
jgi:hypothetical protein